jgi:hypothetical protein
MQYLLIIFDDPSAVAASDRAAITAEYFALTGDLRERGVYLGGNALEPVTTATTIRVRGGKRLVTDGPFAESKEHLVGYFLIEASDLDQAIDVAARIPGSRTGAIEVRPIRHFD